MLQPSLYFGFGNEVVREYWIPAKKLEMEEWRAS
jgi:hypothetical protein